MVDFDENNFEEAFVNDFVEKHGNQVTAYKTEYYEVKDYTNLSFLDKTKARVKELFSSHKRKLGQTIRRTGNLTNEQVRQLAHKKYKNMTQSQKLDIADKWRKQGKNLMITENYLKAVVVKKMTQTASIEEDDERRAKEMLGLKTDEDKLKEVQDELKKAGVKENEVDMSNILKKTRSAVKPVIPVIVEQAKEKGKVRSKSEEFVRKIEERTSEVRE